MNLACISRLFFAGTVGNKRIAVHKAGIKKGLPMFCMESPKSL